MNVLRFFMRPHENAVLMEAMISKLGLTDTLRSLPDHTNVLRRAGERCLQCNHPDQCASWLASNDSPNEAPAYCRNRDLFARTRQRRPGTTQNSE